MIMIIFIYFDKSVLKCGDSKTINVMESNVYMVLQKNNYIQILNFAISAFWSEIKNIVVSSPLIDSNMGGRNTNLDHYTKYISYLVLNFNKTD